jgi:spermidine/putrescine transport system substrate-binding protein
MLLEVATMLTRARTSAVAGFGARAGLGGALTLAGLGLVSSGCQKQHAVLPPPVSVPSGQTIRVLAFPDFFAKTTIPRFETETGNHVTLHGYATSEELLAQLAQDSAADVVFPSSYAVERLIREGKLLAMPRERVPNLVHVSTEFRNPPYDPSLQHCVPYSWEAPGLGYVFKNEGQTLEPSSLKDVFDRSGPRVVWLDDMRVTIGLALRLLGRSASSQQAADLNEAQQLLLAALPRVDNLVTDAGPLLRTGAISLGLAWSTDIYNLHREREDIRFVPPVEGTLLYVYYACVLSQSMHPEVAFAFLNHLLEPQVAAEISNARMLPMPNEEARRLLESDGRAMWGLFEFLRNHNRSYEALRDVGPALPAYEHTWRAVQEGLAAHKARRQRDKLDPPAGDPLSARTSAEADARGGKPAGKL